MGFFSFLFTLIVGMIIVGVAFTIIDVAQEIAPTEISTTTDDVVQGVSFLSKPVSPTLIAGLIIGFVILFIGYRFYTARDKAQTNT
jgi:hypothetical protein